MKFFLDTGNIEEIKRITRLGLVDGVTTNPSLIAKEGRLFKDVIKEIVAIVLMVLSARKSLALQQKKCLRKPMKLLSGHPMS